MSRSRSAFSWQVTRVPRPFRWIRLSSGDDTNDVLFLKIAVAYDQDVQFDAHTKEDIALLQVRMLRVGYYSSKVIKESRLGFIERNAVLLLICHVLGWVPFEAEIVHTYSVLTT